MVLPKISDLVVRRILGIDVNNKYRGLPQGLDKRAEALLDPADTYLEDEPSVAEWLKELKPTKKGAVDYITNLFPSASWARRYNLRWLAGDVLAGTVCFELPIPNTKIGIAN